MVEVLFSNSSSGRIQGKLDSQKREDAPAIILLPPHPQYGCTMENKVMVAMHQVFFDCGYTVLRINYRGVGKSVWGINGAVVADGELSDAASALDWLEHQNPTAKHYGIAGVSFGAWIGMQLLMRRPEIEEFIATSAPTQSYDFSFLSPCPVSGVFIHGSQDEVSPLVSLNALLSKIRIQKNTQVVSKIVEGANHFFDNHIDAFKKTLKDYLAERGTENQVQSIESNTITAAQALG